MTREEAQKRLLEDEYKLVSLIDEIYDDIGSCVECKLKYVTTDKTTSCEKDITNYGYPPKRPNHWYCADFERITNDI